MATQFAEENSILGLDNPMGTDGFEFVEYTAPDPGLLRDLFTKMGFPAVARHKRKDVTLHRQGEINFIINAEPGVMPSNMRTITGQAHAQWHSGSRTPSSRSNGQFVSAQAR
jgi:4-hydroxyphenylpyruvate dioxygenase-like putative hemolysin